MRTPLSSLSLSLILIHFHSLILKFIFFFFFYFIFFYKIRFYVNLAIINNKYIYISLKFSSLNKTKSLLNYLFIYI